MSALTSNIALKRKIIFRGIQTILNLMLLTTNNFQQKRFINLHSKAKKIFQNCIVDEHKESALVTV